MSLIVLVDNPGPDLRTFRSAHLVAERLIGSTPDEAIHLVDFGQALLDWSRSDIGNASAKVGASDFLIVASPTYKRILSGLLKLFLDRIRADESPDVTAALVILRGDLRHVRAPELLLEHVLVEIGVTCPMRGHFLFEEWYDDTKTLKEWATVEERQVVAASGYLR